MGSLVDDAKRFLLVERTPYGSGSLRQGNKTSAKAGLSRRAGHTIKLCFYAVMNGATW